MADPTKPSSTTPLILLIGIVAIAWWATNATDDGSDDDEYDDEAEDLSGEIGRPRRRRDRV